MLLTGETYEYLVVNEKSVTKLNKVVAAFPQKERIEFLDMNKLRIESVRQVKTLFSAVDTSLKNLRYLTI